VVLVGSLLWLGAMLWQGVTVTVGQIHVTCGTAVGASQDTYTTPNPAQAACKHVARQRVSDTKQQAIPAIAVGGARSLIAGIAAFRPARAQRSRPALTQIGQ
jgi:hypothetical protein